jgi:mycothiol synthase
LANTLARIRPVELATLTEEDGRSLLAFSNRIRAELAPDNPPVPLEDAMRAWRNIPDTVSIHAWLAWSEEGEVVGRAQLMVAKTKENAHLAQPVIQVLPEWRQHGIARELLLPVTHKARDEGRRLMLCETSGFAPAGSAFMERLGAVKGAEAHKSQLKLADVDRALLRRWCEKASERASDFEVGLWDGPFPEDSLEAIAALYEVMNTQPMGALEVEAQKVQPEHLREADRVIAARGMKRLAIYAREKSTGRFAGFTDVMWSPSAPDALEQSNTGVFPEFRDRGLGRWLKAALLERVLSDMPHVKFVRTSNVDTNAAMLNINRELGFKPYTSRVLWQIEIERVETYLRAAAGAARPLSK